MPDFKLSATLEGHGDDVRLLVPASVPTPLTPRLQTTQTTHTDLTFDLGSRCGLPKSKRRPFRLS